MEVPLRERGGVSRLWFRRGPSWCALWCAAPPLALHDAEFCIFVFTNKQLLSVDVSVMCGKAPLCKLGAEVWQPILRARWEACPWPFPCSWGASPLLSVSCQNCHLHLHLHGSTHKRPAMANATNGAAAAHHPGGRDHVVLFPFMAKGHTLPLLHFATALSAMHHRISLRVTVVTTPANLAFARSHVPSSVRLAVLPFPSLPPLPAGVESTDVLPSPSLFPTFLQATALLREPFAQLMASLSSPPLVLVSDFFLGFTRGVAADAGVRCLVFRGMSCFSSALCKAAIMGPLPSCARDGGSFHVPRMPAHLKFTAAEVPPVALAPKPKTTGHEEDPDASSWGVLVNSFAEVDEDFVPVLESFYQPGARAWLVGPLFLAAGDALQEEQDPEGCLLWLDQQSEPVVYVSFGTQAHVADEQLGELARGLAQAGHPFLWALRSETWSPPVELGPHGRVVRGWVPQRSVLAHRAVGGFVSHCGWNSVMESLAAGKPVLAWPMMAEQPVNAKHVADIIGAGIRMTDAVAVDGKAVVVGKDEVEKKVRRLMYSGGEEGRTLRARAAWAQQAAMSAVSAGGTSQVTLLKLLQELQRSYDRDLHRTETDLHEDKHIPNSSSG